jgi:hypothetical protein
MKALFTSPWGQLLLTLDGSIMSVLIATVTRMPGPCLELRLDLEERHGR